MFKNFIRIIVSWYISLTFAAISSEINIGVIISSNTPQSAISILKTLKLPEVFELTYIEISDLKARNYEEFDLFIEFTYSELYNQNLYGFSSLTGIPVVLADYGNLPIEIPAFVLHTGFSFGIISLKNLLISLKWDTFFFICSESYRIDCDEITRATSIKIVNFFIFSEDVFQSELDRLVAKMIKSVNNRRFLIVASAEVARLFVNSLKNKKLYTEATGVIVYGEALALLNDSGIIAVVEKGLENMSSSNDYQIKPILNLLNYLNDQGVSDKSALIQQLSAYFLNKKTPPKICILQKLIFNC